MISSMEKKKKFIINVVYLAIWSMLIYFAVTFASAYLLPFLIGIIIAYLVQKPSAFLNKKTGIETGKCAAILSVIIYLFVMILFFLFCWFLASQFSGFVDFLSNNSQQIKNFFVGIYEKLEFAFKNLNFKSNFKDVYYDAINNLLLNITSYLSSWITAVIKNIPTILLSVVVTVVATCFISKDYERLTTFVKGFLDKERCKVISDLKSICTECFLKFSLGYFWLFLITFAELTLGFLIIGINRFVFLAFLVALLDLLPVIGTGTVLLPWAIVEFLQNEYGFGMKILVIYLSVTLIRNFIEPKIIGKQIDINPLFTLIFIFIGFKIGGIIGMIVLPMVFTVLFTYFRRRIASVD